MNTVNRLKRITEVRMAAVRNVLEHPGVAVPQRIRQIQETLGDAAGAEAKAMAIVHLAEGALTQGKSALVTLQETAAAALKCQTPARDAGTQEEIRRTVHGLRVSATKIQNAVERLNTQSTNDLSY